MSAPPSPGSMEVLNSGCFCISLDPAALRKALQVDSEVGDAGLAIESAALSQISRAGIDSEAMAERRQQDGTQSCVKSWLQLLQRIAEKSRGSPALSGR